MFQDNGVPGVPVLDVTGDGGDAICEVSAHVAQRIVPTTADFTSVTTRNNWVHSTSGYATARDGGHRRYQYDQADSSTVNDGSVINGPGGVGRFLALDNAVNVLQWGLVGDRTTDNVTRFNALMTWLKTRSNQAPPVIYFPAGFYLFATRPTVDLPCAKILGDGMNATFIVGDNGLLCNYPQPVIRDIAITPEASTSAGTGLELRNTWQSVVENVMIHDFDLGCLLTMTDEGDGLIPGNTPGGPYPIPQFGGGGRHDSWPSLDEFKRDAKTTTEHWGSRVSLARFTNLHIKGDATGQVGLKLDNPLADPASDYDDFDSLSGTGGMGVFFTGVVIEGGHVFCRKTCIHIGGGIHGVRIGRTYCDCTQEGIRLDYGAQSVEIDNVSLDFGSSGNAIPWQPLTAYSVDDVVQVGDRQYKCTTGGTSAANIHNNGCPNSEFVGVNETVRHAPVAGPANPNDFLTQAGPYGMRRTGDVVQLFINGVEILDGKRWLNCAAYLPSVQGGAESLTIFFGQAGLANQHLEAVSGNQLYAQFLIQNLDPRGVDQPEITGLIRGNNSSGSQTEQSTGVDIDQLTGFADGSVVTYGETYTLTDGATTRAITSVTVKFEAGQSGFWPFRVAQPQLNIGASLGDYVPTYGRPRSRWQDGPQGTGTGIADGTCVWDYDGTPIAAIIAPRVCWESTGNDSRPEISIVNQGSRFRPLFNTNTLPSFENVVLPNPANSNSHVTTIPD